MSYKENKIRKEIKQLQEELQDVRQRRTMVCPRCKKRSPITKWSVARCSRSERRYSMGQECEWYGDGYVIECPKGQCVTRVAHHWWMNKDNHNHKELTEDEKLLMKTYDIIKEYSYYFGEQLDVDLSASASFEGITYDDIRQGNKHDRSFYIS